MGLHNSLSLYRDLYISLLHDIACGSDVSLVELSRDCDTIRNRVQLEGIQFLTVYLPSVGKAFDKALLSGFLPTIPGLKVRKGTNIPSFLGCILSKVFQNDGHLHDHPDTGAIKAFRQLVYFLYKLEMPVKESLARKAIESFKTTESDLSVLSVPLDGMTVMAQRFIAAIFCHFDETEIMPRHGPGGVADGEQVNEKHLFTRIYDDIERKYPFTEYFVWSLSQVCDEYHTYDGLESRVSGTAKVVLVPKDSRGPRIISCEPVEYQWIQQGLGRKVQDHVESSWLTKGHVNFTDQEVNRRLALAGSKSQTWVTLDMKEASDRVSTDLVRTMFGLTPRLVEALMATRSSATRLPDGTVITLKKFAPMGSCLCFPIESILFYVLAVTAVACTYNLPRREARKLVYVYGDDLIVHREVYPAVLQRLPAYGLMFNADKCCTSGFFRESCGCDAYGGVDVTPLRLKKMWDRRNTIDAGAVAAYVALSNAAYSRGYYRLSELAKELVEHKLGPLPYFTRESGVYGWIREKTPLYRQPSGVRTRFNKRLQRLEVFGYRSKSVTFVADSDNWSSVLRRMNSSSEGAQPGVYAVPRRSYLQRGWSEVR